METYYESKMLCIIKINMLHIVTKFNHKSFGDTIYICQLLLDSHTWSESDFHELLCIKYCEVAIYHI